MHMGKLWLEEGFCPVDKYYCMMPIEYSAVESNGEVRSYVKEKMACRHALDGTCNQVAGCEFYQKAPTELDKSTNWYEP